MEGKLQLLRTRIDSLAKGYIQVVYIQVHSNAMLILFWRVLLGMHQGRKGFFEPLLYDLEHFCGFLGQLYQVLGFLFSLLHDRPLLNESNENCI